MDIQEGDIITISGKVTVIYDKHYVLMDSGSGEHMVNVKDIKTHRPIDDREEDDLR